MNNEIMKIMNNESDKIKVKEHAISNKPQMIIT